MNRAIAIAAGLLALVSAGDAMAYRRTSICMGVTAQTRVPAAHGACGTPIFWPTTCGGFSEQTGASKMITFARTEQVLTAGLAPWMSAPCPGGGSPLIKVSGAAPADCGEPQYSLMAGTANVVMFRDDAWPYEGPLDTLA